MTPQGAGYRGTFATALTDSTGTGAGAVDWTFTIADLDIDDLGVGDVLVQDYEVKLDDGEGGIAIEIVSLSLTGTNDAPIIAAGGDTSGAVTEIVDLAPGENVDTLSDTGTLSFTDVDLSDAHPVSVDPQGGGAGFRGTLNASIGDPSTGDGSGTVAWTFEVADADLDDLAEGQQLVQAYDVTVDDGAGGTSTETVEITITGSNDGPTAVADVLAVEGDLDAFVVGVEVDATPDFGLYFNDGNAVFTGVAFDTNAGNGARGFDVALVDLDGDGDVDAFVGNGSANQIWLNDGAGNFSLGQTIGGSTSRSEGVDLGDFDGDGDLDAVSNGRGGPFTIWENRTGDGGYNSGDFTGAGTLPTIGFSYDLALGDFNGDGRLDIFDAEGFGCRLWLNNGGATLSAGNFSLTGPGGVFREVAVGDVDNDGDLDIAGANAGSSSAVLVNQRGLQGGVEGTFATTASFGTEVSNVALGDMDGDGFLDAFVLGNTRRGAAQKNEVWLNNGAGGFIDSLQDLGHQNSYAVALGDLDGDGGGFDEDTVATIATADLLANDTDPDQGAMLTVFGLDDAVTTTTTSAEGATVTLVGTDIIYDPSGAPALQELAEGETRDDTFDYTIADEHGATSTASVTLTVTGINDAPVVTSGPQAGGVVERTDGAPDENAPPDHTADGTITFDDVDLSDTHTVTVTEQGPGYRGSLATALTDSTGTGAGSVAWTFEVADLELDDLAVGETLLQTYEVAIEDNNGAIATEIVALTLTGTNDAPVIAFAPGNDAGAVLEDDPVDTVTGQLSATDVDNGATQAWLVDGGGVSNFGTLGVDATGQWTYTLDNATPALADLDDTETAIETFTVRIEDGLGGTDTQTVTVDVNGHTDNLPPEANDQTVSLDEDTSDTFVFDASDLEPPGDTLDFELIAGQGPQNGTVTFDDGAGTFDYTPDENYNGADDFTYIVTDTFGATDTATVAITVNAVNDAPEIALPSAGGVPDFFVSATGGNDRVLFNDGTGVFTDSGQSLAGSIQGRDAAVGDFDGAGDLDVVVGNANYGGPGYASIFLNDGAGTFSLSQEVPSDRTWGAEVGDLDGDGSLDIMLASRRALAHQVLLNDGSGTFTEASTFSAGAPTGTVDIFGVELGDVDGDGDLDAVMASRYSGEQVWRNDGSGNFTLSQTLGINRMDWNTALGDIDNDGDLDIVTARSYGANRVWLNDGAGTFTPGTNFGVGTGSTKRRDVALSDLDADGDLDAYVAHANEPDRVWLNNGSGIFTDTGQALATFNYTINEVELADIDGDGDLDAGLSSGTRTTFCATTGRERSPTARKSTTGSTRLPACSATSPTVVAASSPTRTRRFRSTASPFPTSTSTRARGSSRSRSASTMVR